MTRRARTGALAAALLVCASLSLSTPARAETRGTLAEAEAAYAEVDLDRTYALSLSALGAGGHGVKETARLYLLYAIAAAATDRTDEAREAFLRVLAIDGSGKLDKNLSPKIRAPYLEARGAFADAGGGASLGLALTRRDDAPVLTVRGPLGAVSRVVLRVRRGANEDYRELTFAPAEQVALPEALHGQRFEYVAYLEDAAGNRMHELGSETVPRRFGAIAASPAVTPATSAPAAPSATPYHVGAGVLAALGLGAAGTGVAFQLAREDAAREWNSAACESPGATRGEQCSAVDARRADNERLSIGFYAAGGVFLAASAVTLLVAPSTHTEKPTSSAFACAAAFGGMSCAGRF